MRHRVLALAVVAIGAALPSHEVLSLDETYGIGVEVDLHPRITGHWLQGKLTEVTDALVMLAANRLSEVHPHWTFVDGRSANLVARVRIAVVERGPNEMLVEVSLRLRPADGQEIVHKLGDVVLYRPGDFERGGLPTPSNAQEAIWTRVRTLLDERQPAHLAELSAQVPLARDPKPFEPGGTAVLPLAKDRYEHLATSRFRLICSQGQRQDRKELLTEASGEWDAYDLELPAALKVRLEEEIPDGELGLLKPLLVYLQEYKVQNDLLYVPRSDAP